MIEGIILAIGAGLMLGLYALPEKFTKDFKFENTWGLFFMLTMFVVPVIASLTLIEGFGDIFASLPFDIILKMAILSIISKGSEANISPKPSISVSDAITGTTNMVSIKNKPQVFSNLKSLVNFSGKALPEKFTKDFKFENTWGLFFMLTMFVVPVIASLTLIEGFGDIFASLPFDIILKMAILSIISKGSEANISPKPSISVSDAITGTTNMVSIKNKPQVFSNLKSLVNFSGKAYKPSINPAPMAKIIPSIIIISLVYLYSVNCIITIQI